MSNFYDSTVACPTCGHSPMACSAFVVSTQATSKRLEYCNG